MLERAVSFNFRWLFKVDVIVISMLICRIPLLPHYFLLQIRLESAFFKLSLLVQQLEVRVPLHFHFVLFVKRLDSRPNRLRSRLL